MTSRKNHAVGVYRRREKLFVTIGVVHSGGGERMLDFILAVDNGWEGLPAALAEAERYALEALSVPEAERHFDIAAKGLVRGAGCKSYRSFVNGSVMVYVIRLEDKCVVKTWTPTARGDGFGLKEGEAIACDPAAAIETLAPVVRKALESA